MNWRNEQFVGFSVKSMEELVRVSKLGINMVEIKLEKFNKGSWWLYAYAGRKFEPSHGELANLSEICQIRNLTVQFHLPIESCLSLNKETGLNLALLEHHDIYLERFMMLEYIYRKHGLGRVITLHPPLVSVKSVRLFEDDEVIQNARIFFERLDRIRMEQNHQTIIGLENQTDIKAKAGNLGFLPKHFKQILKNTRTIGLTVDTGHRRLASAFSIRGFLQTGIPFVNFHFHGNDGVFDPENWKDDQHLLPTPENITGGAHGYRNYMRYFRRYRTPVVLEISHLERYTDEELATFVKNFRAELE